MADGLIAMLMVGASWAMAGLLSNWRYLTQRYWKTADGTHQ